MSIKEERDDFWRMVALVAIVLCGFSWFITFCMVTSDSYKDGVLQMYQKLCPIEQLKEADNGGKN